MEWRLRTRAEFQGIAYADLLATVQAAQAVIHTAKRECIGESFVADIRGTHVPEAPEASLRLGLPILCNGLPDGDGRRKVNLLGDDEGRAVHAWLTGYAVDVLGLEDVYGVPARGFAGGYR